MEEERVVTPREQLLKERQSYEELRGRVINLATELLSGLVGNAYRNNSPQISIPDNGEGTVRYAFTEDERDRLYPFNKMGMLELRPYGLDVYTGNDPNIEPRDIWLWYGEDESYVDICDIELDDLMEMTLAICTL